MSLLRKIEHAVLTDFDIIIVGEVRGDFLALFQKIWAGALTNSDSIEGTLIPQRKRLHLITQ
jgi:hypothetical protein